MRDDSRNGQRLFLRERHGADPPNARLPDKPTQGPGDRERLIASRGGVHQLTGVPATRTVLAMTVRGIRGTALLIAALAMLSLSPISALGAAAEKQYIAKANKICREARPELTRLSLSSKPTDEIKATPAPGSRGAQAAGPRGAPESLVDAAGPVTNGPPGRRPHTQGHPREPTGQGPRR